MVSSLVAKLGIAWMLLKPQSNTRYICAAYNKSHRYILACNVWFTYVELQNTHLLRFKYFSYYLLYF